MRDKEIELELFISMLPDERGEQFRKWIGDADLIFSPLSTDAQIQWGEDNAKRYHNRQHLIGVALIAEYLAMCSGKPRSFLVSLLGVAHDYGYEICITDDTQQVLLSAAKFWKDCRGYVHRYFGSKRDFDNSMNFLSYPHIELTDELTEEQKHAVQMVRDADMIYSTLYCSSEVLKGLHEDYVKPREGLDWVGFLKRNIDFLRGLKVDNPDAMSLHRDWLDDALFLHQTLIVCTSSYSDIGRTFTAKLGKSRGGKKIDMK